MGVWLDFGALRIRVWQTSGQRGVRAGVPAALELAQQAKRFKSTRQLQRFVSIHDPIANLFHFPRSNLSSSDHRDLRSAAMATWSQISKVATT
jgi:hypothetical protein